MDLCLHVVATTNDASMNCFLLSRESLEVVPRCWSWFACCWCRCHCCCAWSTTCIKSENIVLEKMWIRIHTYLFLSVGTEKASQRQKCDLLRMGLEPQVLWNWWWQQRSAIPHFTPTLKYWSSPKMLQKRATPRSFPLPPKNSLVIKKILQFLLHFNPEKKSPLIGTWRWETGIRFFLLFRGRRETRWKPVKSAFTLAPVQPNLEHTETLDRFLWDVRQENNTHVREWGISLLLFLSSHLSKWRRPGA